MDQTRADLEAEAKKNQRAHQAAEAAALALLIRARNSVADDGGGRAAAVAAALRPRLRDAIILGRQGARDRGVKRLILEASKLGVTIDSSILTSFPEFARDWRRANVVSQSYSDRWLRKAIELEDLKAASAATRGSLERIAATESSEAFTRSRTQLVETVRTAELMRVWDATLDKRTCGTCERSDGTIVGVREPFPAGEPGAVHAFCRCGWTLTTVAFTRKVQN